MEAKRWQKTYIELLGVCCASEVPAVEKILNSLQGIKEYKVIVPTRTVIVVHDSLLISHLQIVNALNQARLEATVKVSGRTNFQKKWPSPYAMASGVLLALSLFKYVYSPLRWVALGSVAVGIVPLLLKGIASARKLRLDANILMLIAAVGTVCLGDYTEAGTIVFLFCIAEWLEARASYKAQAVMSSLMSIAPQKAVLAETGEQVDVDDVKPNTVIAVKAGEVIPIDGVVVDGMSEVDEKTLTGESFPVAKEKDSTVWAGTINLNGYVTVKTTALAEDCMVAKMTKLMEEAQNSKSATQRFVDRCAQYYTPADVVISASLAVVPFMLRLHNRSHWFHLAVVVLVSACPCALILSTPVATFCALTKAATAGLLIKGGDYLETLAKIKVIAFDKTGTLTRGEFVVNNFETLFHDISSDTLLYWASSIESKSSHPMAAAVVDYAMSRSVDAKPENVEEFLNYPGEGIHGRIDGHSVYIGNRRIAVRAGSGTVPRIDAQMAKGQTIGFIYVQGRAVGVFSLSDVCRTGVKEALDNLKLLNIKSAMLTGDSQSAAMQTQEQLGHTLDEVYSELLPEDKATIVESLKKEGATAMVGDGINDAPALATADIGISMGISGSALATETGQVILMSNDLRKVPKAIKIARKAHRKVIENVVFSIIAKAGILALAFAGHPLIWAAVLADVGTCLLVIMNSMLLLRGTENYSGKCSKLSDALPGREDKNNQPSANCKRDCCAEDKVAKMFNVEDVGVSNSCCKSKLCRKNEYSDSGNFRVINNDMEANTLKCHEDANVSTFCCKSISCRKNEFSDPAERREDRNEAWRSLKVDQCHSGSFQMVIDLEANHPKQQEDVPLSTSCCKSKSCKKNESSDSGKGHVDEIEVWRFDKVDSNTQSSGIRKRCCAEKRVAKLCNIEDVPATSSCCESKSGKNEFSDLPKRQQDQCHSGSFQMVNNDLLASNPKCHEDVPIGISCCKSNSCGKNESSSSAWRHQDQNVVDRSVKGDQCDSGSFQMVNCDLEANKPKPDDVPVSTSCCKNKSCKKDESSELAKRVKDQNKVCESEKDQCDGDNFQMLDLEANNPKLDGVPVSTSCCKTKSCRKNERSDSAKRHQNQKKACQSDKQKQCHYGDQHQHLDIHHVHPVDTLSYGESSKTITNNYRSSLEKTEIIGCCRIYLEECCSQLEQILNRGLGGGILEIITE